MKQRSDKIINKEISPAKILIIGGSLSGLSCALACARYGIPTRVVKRVEARNRSGGGLGINRELLASVTGFDPRVDQEIAHLPVIKSYRESTSWLALHNWLRSCALQSPHIK